MFGDEVSSDYVEGIIAESGVHEDKRISYDEFLSLWKVEDEERNLEFVRTISQFRSVRQIEDDLNNAPEDNSSESELSFVIEEKASIDSIS